MLLLPLLAGLSLVLHGTSSYVVGVHDRGDYNRYRLGTYSDIIRRLTQYDQKLKEEKRRQYELREEDPKVEAYEDFNREINLAADTGNPGTVIGEVEQNEPTAAPPTQAKLSTTTTTGKPTQQPHQPPEPPQAITAPKHGTTAMKKDDFIFAAIVAACSVAGFVGLVMAGVCWYKLHRRVKAASDVDYPAYGVTGPTKERLPSPGDRKLAQSAQMYHYQHQKQQMIAMEKANGEMKPDGSEEESEEENEEGDYTVYECPGLAPTGEMEVRNPLFTEDAQTPVNGQGPAAPVNGLPDTAADAQE